MGFFDFLKNKEDRYTKRGADGRVYYDPPGQHMIILKDCMKLMESTTNPSTFFSRAKLAYEKALYCEHEPEIIWNGMNCKQISMLLGDRESLDRIHTQFIDRLFANGKEDNITFQLHEVGHSMSEKTLNYFIQRLNGKMYHFCKVGFSGADKLYTYVTKDRSIAKGDMVTIPTGNKFAPGTDLVQVADVFDSPLEDLEFPLIYLRCIKNKYNITCPECGAK